MNSLLDYILNPQNRLVLQVKYIILFQKPNALQTRALHITLLYYPSYFCCLKRCLSLWPYSIYTLNSDKISKIWDVVRIKFGDKENKI